MPATRPDEEGSSHLPTRRPAAVPLGFITITVGGFLLLLLGVPLVALYSLVVLSCTGSIGVFAILLPTAAAPHAPSTSAATSGEPSHFGRFASDIRSWREWMPAMWQHTVALMFNMLTVSFMTAIM